MAMLPSLSKQATIPKIYRNKPPSIHVNVDPIINPSTHPMAPSRALGHPRLINSVPPPPPYSHESGPLAYASRLLPCLDLSTAIRQSRGLLTLACRHWMQAAG
jgi:hypothetical protein